MIKKLLSGAAMLILATAVVAQGKLDPETLWKLRRVATPEISPDGKKMVYSVKVYDLPANKGNADLYVQDIYPAKSTRLKASTGKKFQLTNFEGSEFNYRWHPDGNMIGFLSGKSGSTQLWEINVDGSGLRQVTDLEGGIANFHYAPDGKHICFTQDVKLDQTVNDLYPDLPKAEARIIDDLMYRHWDAWHDFHYSHVFYAPYSDGKLTGEPVDIMKGEKYDSPLNPFGGAEQIAWTMNGGGIVYTCKKKSGKDWTVSTNSDLYHYNLKSGKTENLTEGMVGYDMEPAFSPDGKYMAWLSMERDGFESDRNRIFIWDMQKDKKRELTVDFDQSSGHLSWSSDSKTLYFTSAIKATYQIFKVEIGSGNIQQLSFGTHNYYSVAEAGEELVGRRASMSAPHELYRVNPETAKQVQITNENKSILDNLNMGEVKERTVKTTDGKDMLVWVIYPPGFDENKKYPTLLYCQGGPQSAVSQFFSYRWNFQLMAANGYIVVAPNRRGLPSFGQEWNDQISGDWGGQNMKDYLSAIDDVAKESYVDKDRLGAVGASYGGYSVYYLAGIHEKRFKTFISHCGLFNLESWYGATEEMFFANFDLKGAYWQNPKPVSYQQFSPHKLVGNWDTPMLVIHGQRDYRVPVTEGMQAFNAAKLQDIPARFLYFPDEGHWVLSPQNGVLWHRVFFEWLDKWLKK